MQGCQFLVAETCVLSLYECLVESLLLFRCDFVYTSAYQGVFSEVCDFFKYFHLFLLAALEESCKLTLCQHGCAAELAELQSHSQSYGIPHFVHFLASSCVFLARCDVLQRPCGGVKIHVGLFLLAALHMPFRLIFMSVDTLECQYDEGFSRVAPHELSRVVECEFVAVVFHLHPRALPQSGRSAVECKAYGVEDGGLARPRLACNQKYVTVAEGRFREVDHFVLNRGNVVYMQLQYFHNSFF